VSSVNLSEKVTIILTFNCAGAFGNVRIGWLKSDTSKLFAIKTMKKAEIIDSKHVDHIENEKKILEKLNHPFAVS
jgi:serine/threonine protein kinase